MTLELGREDQTVVSERQQFEEATLKMMIDCDLPPTWLEEPSTAALMGHLRPDLTLPTAKHIATTVLDRVAKKAENTMRKKLKTATGLLRMLAPLSFACSHIDGETEACCAGVSLLFDTWVNRTKEHMLGFVVATDDRQVTLSLRLPSTCCELRLMGCAAVQVFAFSVSDVTEDRESAECLGEKVRETVEKVEKEFSVEVHAITAPATCNKGRHLLLPTRPDILAVDCAARQLSLVAGDFFKVRPTLSEEADVTHSEPSPTLAGATVL